MKVHNGPTVHRNCRNRHGKHVTLVIWTGGVWTNEVRTVLTKPGSFPMLKTISKPQYAR